MTESGQIEFKKINEANWTTITHSVMDTTGYFSWYTPVDPGRYQLRWNSFSGIHYSDTFVISTLMLPKVDLVCKDSLLFHWTSMPAADSFELYHLGAQYMEFLDFTKDTSYFIQDASPLGYHFAVAPIFDQQTGKRSYAFDYRTQGAACIVNLFILKAIIGDKAQLEVDLGAIQFIQSLTLLQSINGEYIEIASQDGISLLQYLFDSESLHNGINSFRLVVRLTDGRVITDELLVNYIAENDFVVFPNPVHARDQINVWVGSAAEFDLSITDITGKEVYTIRRANNYNVLDLYNLPSGIYLAVVSRQGQKLQAKPFMIL